MRDSGSGTPAAKVSCSAVGRPRILPIMLPERDSGSGIWWAEVVDTALEIGRGLSIAETREGRLDIGKGISAPETMEVVLEPGRA